MKKKVKCEEVLLIPPRCRDLSKPISQKEFFTGDECYIDTETLTSNSNGDWYVRVYIIEEKQFKEIGIHPLNSFSDIMEERNNAD